MACRNPEAARQYSRDYRLGIRRPKPPPVHPALRINDKLDRRFGQQNEGVIHPDGEPMGVCWEFTGARNHRGYGVIKIVGNKTKVTSRLILEFALGRPLAPGKVAGHLCDNPPCCRPRHLYEATESENLYDQYARERRPRVGPRRKERHDGDGQAAEA